MNSFFREERTCSHSPGTRRTAGGRRGLAPRAWYAPIHSITRANGAKKQQAPGMSRRRRAAAAAAAAAEAAEAEAAAAEEPAEPAGPYDAMRAMHEFPQGKPPRNSPPPAPEPRVTTGGTCRFALRRMRALRCHACSILTNRALQPRPAATRLIFRVSASSGGERPGRLGSSS